jgi:hypothetical protein
MDPETLAKWLNIALSNWDASAAIGLGQPPLGQDPLLAEQYVPENANLFFGWDASLGRFTLTRSDPHLEASVTAPNFQINLVDLIATSEQWGNILGLPYPPALPFTILDQAWSAASVYIPTVYRRTNAFSAVAGAEPPRGLIVVSDLVDTGYHTGTGSLSILKTLPVCRGLINGDNLCWQATSEGNEHDIITAAKHLDGQHYFRLYTDLGVPYAPTVDWWMELVLYFAD